MRSIKSILGAGALLCAASLPAFAVTIGLTEYGFNIDGTVTHVWPSLGDPQPSLSVLNLGSFSDATGLGRIRYTVSGVGTHYFGSFFDHDIEGDPVNGFINETGSAHDSPASGQSWVIDEPGNGNRGYYGSIWDKFSSGSLDNSAYSPGSPGDDIAMAMGWSFSLSAGETATIDLYLSTANPGSGFYLQQTDLVDGNVFLYGNLDISAGGTPAPDGGATVVSLLIGLLGLAGVKRAVNRREK